MLQSPLKMLGANAPRSDGLLLKSSTAKGLARTTPQLFHIFLLSGQSLYSLYPPWASLRVTKCLPLCMYLSCLSNSNTERVAAVASMVARSIL